jgi:hypothetical protein
MEHYYCYQCYITATQVEQILDTVEFFQCNQPNQNFPHKRQPLSLGKPKSLSTNKLLTWPQQYCNSHYYLNIHHLNQHLQGWQQVSILPRVVAEAVPVATQTRSATTAINLQQYWANSVIHLITGVAMEYQQLISDPTTKEPPVETTPFNKILIVSIPAVATLCCQVSQ